MSARLQDKVALITGAARGIGAAIADVFVAEGAKLALIDLDLPALQKTASAIADDVLACRADIAKRDEAEQAVAQALDRFGKIDILINNAGMNVFADPLELSEEDWQRCMAVNLEGAWNFIRAVLPSMLDKGKGSIVNIASTHAFSIIPGCFPYPVAKHALLGLTRSLAIDYAPKGIRINAIAPGYIETQIVKDWFDTFDDPAAARKRVEDLIPVRRIGTPKEVALACVYLASDESGFTTGSVLTMDGGRSVVYHD
jgi:NAD(P)-dependent dehydrogenase (short-subunit alcohol dehydrogenase family)